MEDERIVELFWARAALAVPAAAEKYGAYCTAIAQRILSDPADAEECVNDTWLQAWRTIPPARPVSLSAYLGRICRNLAFNRWKAQQADKRGCGQLPALPEDKLSPTMVGDTAVIFGQRQMPYGPYDPETKTPTGTYTLCTAEFTTREGVACSLVSHQLEPDEVVQIVYSLLCDAYNVIIREE